MVRYLVVATLALGMLTGATCLDSAAGVKTNADGSKYVDPNAGLVPVVNVVKEVGGGTPVGWAATAAGWLLALWGGLRAKGTRAALVSTAMTLEDFFKSPEGQTVKDYLKEKLAKGHDQAGVQKIIEGVVAKFGHSS